MCSSVLKYLLKKNVVKSTISGVAINSIGLSPGKRDNEYLEQINAMYHNRIHSSFLLAVYRPLSFRSAYGGHAKHCISKTTPVPRCGHLSFTKSPKKCNLQGKGLSFHSSALLMTRIQLIFINSNLYIYIYIYF